MVDFFSDDYRRNPYPVYAQLRKSYPVLHVPQADMWMIFDYETVKRVLNDTETFSSSLANANRPNPQWLIFFDPPRHTQLRGLVSRAFTPKMIAGLEQRIRELSRGLLDQVAGRNEMDLALDYSVPLPLMVIMEMVGIPGADWPLCRRWSDVILKMSYDVPGTGRADEDKAEYMTMTSEMSAYLDELTSRRRATPTDDLLSGLVHAEFDGERLTDAEILGFMQILLVAGHETTTNLINNAVLSLLEHPEEMDRLRENRDLLPSAIEEVLRYRCPVQWMLRTTTRDVELRGQAIPAGKLLIPVMGSANRDPRQFPDPDSFNISRDPNAHVAFGHGIHFCLGAPLSRLEARIALGDILDRFEHLELAGDGPWVPRKALHVMGPENLPVRFERAATSAV